MRTAFRWSERAFARDTRLGFVIAVLAVTGCGGGGGGNSGGTGPPPPPPPPDNTPARVTLSQTAPLSLTSGTTSTVVASVFTADNRLLSGQAVTWVSSNVGVARVEGGVITAALVGNATITAAAGAAVSTGLAVTVSPGSPARLAMRTQPAGATVALPLATQPVVEIRDAAGNLVVSSTLTVNVALESGGGALTGNPVSAVAGVAQFNGVTLTGIVGERRLSFSATGLTSVTSASFALAPGIPSVAVVTRQPLGGAIAAPLLTQPIVELRDVSGNVSTGSAATVTASLVGGVGLVSGGVAVNTAAGIATFTTLRIEGAPGNYTLGFSASGLGVVEALPVTLVPILYGLDSRKIQYLDAGQAVDPVVSAGTPPQFRSSAVSRVSVNDAGRFTGRAEGQAWIAATIAAGSDSILAIVARGTTGPVVRTNLSNYALGAATTTSIGLVLDPRNTVVGAISVTVTLNSQSFTPSFQAATLSIPGAQVVSATLEGGVVRFSLVASTPITSPVTFGRIDLMTGPPGSRLTLDVVAIDAAAADGSNVFSNVTSTFFPLIFR
ncbi:MAG: hypothetical protein ACT4OZ_12685 [Gemmatimonadota bacterium]